MQFPLAVVLNQAGLIIGFAGAVLLGFSNKVGVISNDGSIIFNGLDPMDPAEDNVKRVKASHWRNRFFTPVGWFLLSVSFLVQLIGTWL